MSGSYIQNLPSLTSLLPTDYMVVSRDGMNLYQTTLSELITKSQISVKQITSNYTLTQDDNNVIFDFASAATITIPEGLVSFTAAFIPPDTGNATFVVSGAVTINGSSASLTRSSVNNIVQLIPRFASNTYKLTGI